MSAKHKEFSGMVPHTDPKVSVTPAEELPSKVVEVPSEDFSRNTTPSLRERGSKSEIYFIQLLLRPYKDLADKYLSDAEDSQVILWNGRESLLTVGDLKRISLAYERLERVVRTIEWLEARLVSGTDPLFSMKTK